MPISGRVITIDDAPLLDATPVAFFPVGHKDEPGVTPRLAVLSPVLPGSSDRYIVRHERALRDAISWATFFEWLDRLDLILVQYPGGSFGVKWRAGRRARDADAMRGARWS